MNRGATIKNSPKALAAREKEVKALYLLAAGASYVDIARQVGYYDQSGAKKACDRILDRREIEPNERFKKLQMIRYRALLLGVYARATAGEDEAFKNAIEAMKGMERVQGVIGSSGLSGGVNVNDAQVHVGDRIQVNQFTIPATEEGRARLADRLREIQAITSGVGEVDPDPPREAGSGLPG